MALSFLPLSYATESLSPPRYGIFHTGFLDLPSAQGLNRDQFNIQFSGSLFTEANLTGVDDDISQVGQYLTIAYGILPNLEASMGFTYIATEHDLIRNTFVQRYIGPILGLKYHRQFNWKEQQINYAGLLRGFLQGKEDDKTSISLNSSSILLAGVLGSEAMSLGKYPLHWDIVGGFLLDNSKEIFALSPNDGERIAYNMAESNSFHLGFTLAMPYWRHISPFLEIQTRIYSGTSNPILITPGARLFLMNRLLALKLASVFALAGNDKAAKIPRPPSYQIHLGLSLYFSGLQNNQKSSQIHEEMLYARIKGVVRDRRSKKPLSNAQITVDNG